MNEFDVLRSFEKLNNKKSNVPNALPTRFLKYAAIHIVPYCTHILNFSYKFKTVPSEWKKGFITPVPKVNNNISIDTLRPITQTNIFSKIMEGFMYQHIYDQVISKLNVFQFGAIKKSSTCYCLVSLFDFILKALDCSNVYVVLVLLDLSKAFDLVDHNILIQSLQKLDVNSNDVRWVASFLHKRKQCTKYGTLSSSFLPLKNGTPQGTKIAILLFIVLINTLLKDFYEQQQLSKHFMAAFVDDMSVAEAVKYGEVPDIHTQINRLNDLLTENKMCLNAKKSAVIVVDKSKNKKFSNLKITVNGTDIPKVSMSKLLGVYINESGDWSNHVDFIYRKACLKLQILRKLKSLGFLMNQLKLIYIMHVRSILEYCCVLWSNYLTAPAKAKLISVEKRAISIITGKPVRTANYPILCQVLGIDLLASRWDTLMLGFGSATMKNDRYSMWLKKYQINRPENRSSRYNKNSFNFRLVGAKYERYRRSTIPVLIKALREKY